MMHPHDEVNELLALVMVLDKYTVSKVLSSYLLGDSPSPDTYNPTESFKRMTPIRGFRLTLSEGKNLNRHPRDTNPGPGSYFASLNLYKNCRVPTIKGRIHNASTLFS